MRLAVLIDGDNVSPKAIDAILAKVATLGTASVKRIYGDLTTPGLSGWKTTCANHAIQPVQQFANSTGKNATDSALIIDAMDLLHAKTMEGFCLVSSDADFTRLATRIRENGLAVFGFGEEKTPKAFVKACDRFFRIDVPVDGNKVKPIPVPAKPSPPAATHVARPQGDSLQKLVEVALTAAAPQGGSATLSQVGKHIRQASPDFKPSNYGRSKLSKLIAETPGFKVTGTDQSLMVERR